VIRVSVAIALAGVQEVVELNLAEGATVGDAVAAARQRHPRLDWSHAGLGIWSRACGADRVLREGDRVEVYRALTADPKEQRRLRARR
jgi:uncharacterized protein